MTRGPKRIAFDEDALIRDLGRMSIERAAPLHGMTSRTLHRRMRERPALREAGRRRQLFKDRKGERYGQWEVVRPGRRYREGSARQPRMMWWARCLDCGRESEVRIHNLQYGRSSRCLSCACKLRESEKRKAREASPM